MELKRDFTKVVRDGAKSLYKRGDSCIICGSCDSLEFHHTKSLSRLVNRWVAKLGLKINTLEDAIDWREKFIEEHTSELYDCTLTLCSEHHTHLHKVYGKAPALGTAGKQARWCQKQKDKL